MADLVRYEIKDGVAVITIDNPPVNALSPAVWEGIDQAVARASADPAAEAIVLIGAGTTFIAGADIKVFDTLKTREDSMTRSAGTHALLRRLEDAPKPLVAAIHGNALGGGLEVAQACHFRVATKDAKVGQPEVLLGIIPGAGGTQRLPRLAGAKMALEMSTDGKPVPAPKAQQAGIIDQVIDSRDGDLLTGAIGFAKSKAKNRETRKTREISLSDDQKKAGLEAVEAARAALQKTAKGMHAPHAAVNAIEAGLRRPFDEGSVRERELFAECVVSTESKALRHLFFAEREVAKVPDVPKDTAAKDVKRAAVVGAGTMGGGIAMTYANAGIPVLLKEVDQAALDRGLATIRRNYDVTMSKGKMTAEQVEKTMALITPTTSYDGFDQVDIVVEAVFENMDLKKATFAELGRVTRPDAVLASNSSTLDIDEFARASGRPSQVLGHHFFSPANVMKLLEIVRGRDTSKEAIATSLKLAKKLGKVGVVVGNCFGFVANRMLAYYMREAYLLLEEGASVEQIDRTLTEFGLPVGPYGMQDIAGIDVGARIRQYLKSIGKTRAEGPQSEIPDQLFEMGRYGQKTGAGWYKYDAPGSRNRTSDPLIEQLAEHAAKKRGITRRPIADEEIIARITTALANEGARVLEEGYATRASDIDIIYAYGFGFPRHRGGPMFYADTVGLDTVLARVKEYRARFGDYWEPAPLLEKLAAEGRGFYSEATVKA
ncbi:MAG TPA: 3-hydroxyacyl-CoA dehydrogenase NAD-binding domain-containing protein [Vicinamibacterales bacterium]|jgi:3-hydroxyacyl-CoA dehydrogenase|nr:3-hydroxyacyl-CoA dehydrogenase NAD-binding domain-containing protein [Vicinamibacterales bacterium]